MVRTAHIRPRTGIVALIMTMVMLAGSIGAHLTGDTFPYQIQYERMNTPVCPSYS